MSQRVPSQIKTRSSEGEIYSEYDPKKICSNGQKKIKLVISKQQKIGKQVVFDQSQENLLEENKMAHKKLSKPKKQFEMKQCLESQSEKEQIPDAKITSIEESREINQRNQYQKKAPASTQAKDDSFEEQEESPLDIKKAGKSKAANEANFQDQHYGQKLEKPEFQQDECDEESEPEPEFDLEQYDDLLSEEGDDLMSEEGDGQVDNQYKENYIQQYVSEQRQQESCAQQTKKFKCQFCKTLKEFGSWNSLYDHQSTVHSFELVEIRGGFLCKYCHKYFGNSCKRNNHELLSCTKRKYTRKSKNQYQAQLDDKFKALKSLQNKKIRTANRKN